MKNLLKLLPFLVVALILKACTAELNENEALQVDLDSRESSVIFDTNCTDDLPRTRMINNGTIAFDLQVISEAGVAEITIPNIGPGTTTSWNDFNVGEVLFSITNYEPLVNDEKVQLLMDTCMGYEIVIGPDNTITTFTPILF